MKGVFFCPNLNSPLDNMEGIFFLLMNLQCLKEANAFCSFAVCVLSCQINMI